MHTKRQVLEHLRADDLRAALDAIGLTVDDRRVRRQAIDALVRARKATLGEILTHLSKDSLKRLCRDLGLDDGARAKAELIERISSSTPSTGPTDATENLEQTSAPQAQARVTNYIDSLISRVEGERLREEIAREVNSLRNRKAFGLVFERHLPEKVRLDTHPVRPGVTVEHRSNPETGSWTVRTIDGGEASLQRIGPKGDSETKNASVQDLVVLREFGRPIFPGLASHGRVNNGKNKPWHSVIEAENYHALETVLYTHEGRVDCVYIDPPYNTGAKDWKYNNNFVDIKDAFRHSKWLSFMEKRLRLTRRLLKPDGVLICTIDEHEVHHLGLLLEQIFPDADIQTVTIVINPKGVTRPGSVRFSRVEEYAFFCFFGSASVSGMGDDLLTNDVSEDDPKTKVGERPRWKGLLRSGTNARRQDRRNMFFPVLIDTDSGAVVGTGDPLLDDDPDLPLEPRGVAEAWPVRSDGSWGNWGVGHSTLRRLIEGGFVSAGAFDVERKTWPIKYLSEDLRNQLDAGVLETVARDEATNVVDVRYTQEASRRLKSVWHRSRHDAGTWGSDLLKRLLGPTRVFDFPKSLYGTLDCLAAVTRENPEAVIVDFFAGSGTTLHATCLLNSSDGGKRQCIIVTNNEVGVEDAKALSSAGYGPGDPEWEARGIYHLVTKPRCEAIIKGSRQDGEPLAGHYVDGRPLSDGFDENVEFLRLEYLDRDAVSLDRAFEAIAPLLWLKAGGTGARVDSVALPWAIPSEAAYGVLFDTQHWADFVDAVRVRTDSLIRVYIVTNSTSVFQHVALELPGEVKATMLYEDYLSNFTINGGVRP